MVHILSIRWQFIFSFVLFIHAVSAPAVPPETLAATPFLGFSPSTRVNGMGEAGVSLTDEPSGYYNPAAPTFIVQKWNVITTYYLGKMDWTPRFDNSPTYSYNSLIIGGSKILFHNKKNNTPTPFSVHGAATYYRTRFDFIEGETYDTAHNIVFSGSVKFIAELGAGVTAKRVYSVLRDSRTGETGKADSDTYDYGLLGKLPLVELAEYVTGKSLDFQGLKPEINLSAGAASCNVSGGLGYLPHYEDPFPRYFNRGYSGTVGFSYHGPYNLNIIRFTTVRETYIPQIDGRSFSEECNDNKRGWEISLFETVSAREGKLDDFDGLQHYNTHGVTVASDGLFTILAHLPGMEVKKHLNYIFNHTSVSWSRFKYRETVFGDMKHSQITVNYRL